MEPSIPETQLPGSTTESWLDAPFGPTSQGRWGSFISYLALTLICITLAACTSGIEEITDLDPTNSTDGTSSSAVLLSTTHLQGSTSVAPTSASRAMGIHAFGGTYNRTKSQSAGFILTGEVGID
ncbi:MAG: hypothetical protein COT73_09460 [Bdellovibrio sp. CG10_big_fil_rev_8_21_14_0_10_47_8]|nr:MAG: hypothetical protein COT73_09460 [Bdellovibrio sp. CG10_big_fil_rev_8_21_14_0_10_47_8]